MGTQVGNATPVDALAAASEESMEDSGGESPTLVESSWTEKSGTDY